MIQATKTTIEEFKESLLWQDILNEIDNWIAALKSPEEITGDIIDGNMNSGAGLAMHGYVKGCKEASERFKLILDILLTLKEEKENDSGLNETE